MFGIIIIIIIIICTKTLTYVSGNDGFDAARSGEAQLRMREVEIPQVVQDGGVQLWGREGIVGRTRCGDPPIRRFRCACDCARGSLRHALIHSHVTVTDGSCARFQKSQSSVQLRWSPSRERRATRTRMYTLSYARAPSTVTAESQVRPHIRTHTTVHTHTHTSVSTLTPTAHYRSQSKRVGRSRLS